MRTNKKNSTKQIIVNFHRCTYVYQSSNLLIFKNQAFDIRKENIILSCLAVISCSVQYRRVNCDYLLADRYILKSFTSIFHCLINRKILYYIHKCRLTSGAAEDEEARASSQALWIQSLCFTHERVWKLDILAVATRSSYFFNGNELLLCGYSVHQWSCCLSGHRREAC